MDSFRRIVQSLRSSHRAAGHLNLTGAQLFVIHALHDAGRPLSVSELAARTRTDPSTVSVVVGRLVRKGLVQSVRSTKDNRRAELSLTKKGEMLQRKAPATVAQEKLLQALEELNERDAAVLERLLIGIVDVMGEADTPASMLFDTQPGLELPRKRR
ncbi:MAG TPA: MarR family transcriptional regulator [Thermoanaerobaculia bacterium]|nr:MarR family transcriptional regulator [Thermoanaerobaculia bacterium]